MRNLLATRRGRLATFFMLYVTEGIPFGFTAVAMATQLRESGADPAAVATFVSMLYLPWSFKWAIAPFVDALYSDRLGRRRGWIVGCQTAMAATLLLAVPFDFTVRVQLVALIVLAHNLAAATQDVAIDALAVSTLPEQERGVANGLMFAGQYSGSALGGSGTLFLVPRIGFTACFLLVSGAVLVVMLLVSLRIRESPTVRSAAGGAGIFAAARQVGRSAATAARAFVSSRAAGLGVLFALLPTGTLAVSFLVQQNLAVEFGLGKTRIAQLVLASTCASAAGCVVGGLLSDRWGRRRMLAVYVLLMAAPALCLALLLHRAGWVMPINPKAPDRPVPPAGLVSALWVTGVAYAFALGLMYGTRTALFMDLCNPAVAATQFTAYMSLLNLTIAYSTWWHGRAIKFLGYPGTLLLDVAAGTLCLLLLPWLKPRPRPKPAEPEGAAHPAGTVATATV